MLLPHSSSDSLLECPAGYLFYACASSNFEGCCSINPCELLDSCPIQNQPGFATSPDPMSSATSSGAPEPTSPDPSAPETAVPAPTTATAAEAISPSQLPPYSTSSSPPAPKAPTPPKFNHTGLIAGLVVGLSVALVATAAMLYRFWRHRQTKKVGDEEPFLLMRRLRTKAEGPATPGSPDRNKPVPPVPTSAVPWQGSFSEAGLGRTGDGGRTPTDPGTPTGAGGAPRLRQSSVRAVPFSPSRVGADGDGGGGTGAASSRAASPVDSVFDSSPGRRGSELGTTWVDTGPEYAELRSPSEFHGLSAPPRSRDGSRPGSKGTQAG